MSASKEGIYSILTFISMDKFAYVFYSSSRDITRIYRNHSSHNNRVTASMFDLDEPPRLYLLEHIKATQPRAYGTCVAWCLYLQDCGYTIADRNMRRHMEHMHPNDKDVYDKIKNLPVHQVLSPTTELLNGYYPSEVDNHTIILQVTKNQYDTLKYEAAGAGLTVQEYAARRFWASNVNYPNIHELHKCRQQIIQVANIASNIATQGLINDIGQENVRGLQHSVDSLRADVKLLTQAIQTIMLMEEAK